MARGGNKPSAARQKGASTSHKPTERIAKSADDRNPFLDLHQKCLDIFRDALLPSNDDSSILQEVKGHLYNRDFAAAFGKEEYLRIYASRWSPSRALTYLNLFIDLTPWILPAREGDNAADESSCMRVLCLGGGAGGELVGLGAWLSVLTGTSSSTHQQRFHIDLVDMADWTAVIQRLRAGLTHPPELSKYASQAKKDANKALISGSMLDVDFHQLDALSPMETKQDSLTSLLEKADLVTFMFTLNELYSTSLSATKTLLNSITSSVRSGSILLVVDSPGSYSSVSLNGAKKTYPMQWLLDHTLLGSQGEGTEWKKVTGDDSRWFRLSKELRYPIPLEDMRFQMHVYRRT